MENQVKLNFLGGISKFPRTLQDKMSKAMKKSEKNDRITLNIMVNYGGRDELVYAINQIIAKGIKKVDEKTVKQHLYTGGIPDPDLLIRTASEMRLSNFLLWQIAYTEFYVTPVLWPDFNEAEMEEALQTYKSRQRRFGGL